MSVVSKDCGFSVDAKGNITVKNEKDEYVDADAK